MRIGAITIGQSPRPDLLEEIITPELRGVEFVEAGALDGLRAEEISALAPRPDEPALITRLRDGSTVEVSEELVAPLVSQCLRRLEESGVEATMLLCTAGFRSLVAQRPLFRPYQLLRAVARAVLAQGTLAVVVPEESQLPATLAAWQLLGLEVIGMALPPYHPSAEELSSLVAFLRSHQVGLVVLDCLGYDCATQDHLTRASGLPVLLPRTVLAAVLTAFVASSRQRATGGLDASAGQGGGQ